MDRLLECGPVGKERPGVRRPLRSLRRDRVDGTGPRGGKDAEIDAPFGVCLERERRGVAVVAGFEGDRDGPRRTRLSRLPPDLDMRAVAGTDEKQVLDLVGAVDRVDGKRLTRAELQRLPAGREALHLPGKGERHARKSLGDEKLVRPFPILEELELGHLFGRGDAVEIDRLDRQLRRLEQPERHRPAVDEERRPDDHLGALPCPQALPVDVDPGAEFVRLGRMLEEIEARQFAVTDRRRDHDRLAAGGGAEGDEDRAVGPTRDPLALEEQLRLHDLAAGVVEDREPLPGGGAGHERPQPPLADQRPARAAVADEVDHIHPRLGKLREIDMADAPLQGIVVRFEHELDRRRHPVERDVGVDLLERAESVAAGVDLEDPHRELRDVLHRQIEGHRRLGPEDGGIRGEKLDLHPVAERPVGGRTEHRRVLLLLAQATRELRLGKQPGEVVAFDERGELAAVGRVDEEMGEESAHERLVVADRREQRPLERLPEIAGKRPRRVGRQDLRRHVALRPRELEILEERLLVPRPLGEVEGEEVVADVGLERIVDRCESVGEGLQAIEIGTLHRRVTLPIVVGTRLEFVEHRGHEGRMIDELSLQPGKRVELRHGEEPMDRQRPEAARVRRVEIGGDELLDSPVIGAREPGEELAAADRVERCHADCPVAEPVERSVFVAVERVGGVGLRAGRERLHRHECRVERRRQLRLRTGHDPLVRIGDPEAALEVGHGRVRGGGKRQQRAS